MTTPTRSSSKGKWLAAVIVGLAIVAALAEWKWRPPRDKRPALNPGEMTPTTRP
jgi:hypothetical protein